MTKRILLILLLFSSLGGKAIGSTNFNNYLIAPSDTTRFGEDTDEETGDTIVRKPVNRAEGIDAIRLVLEKRYKSYGEDFTRKWDDHLYVQAGLGVEQMIPSGKGYEFNALTKLNIGLGKQFNKYNSIRLMLSGAWGYQQAKDRMFTIFGVNVDHMFSLSSFFNGYRPTRLLDVSTLLGFGFQHSKLSFKNKLWEQEMQAKIDEWESIGDFEEADIIRNNWPKDQSGSSFEAHIGTHLKFFTGPQGYIALEPYIGIATDKMDLSEHNNWRKTDVFYGLNLNYIYYIHNNLSIRERMNYIKRSKKNDLTYLDSIPKSWQQPWFFEYSNGINFLSGTQLSSSETMGPDISIGVGRWFSPVIGLRLTGAVRQMTWRKSLITISEEGEQQRGYISNMHNIYKGVRIEAIFNPFGFLSDFSWDKPYGAYLLGGVEYGWVDKYQTERLSTRSEAYTGGIHIWCKLSDGLHLFVEPRYMHYNYKVPYTNVNWNKLYSDNSYSVSLGLSVSSRTIRFRDKGAANDSLDVKKGTWTVGLGGGFNMMHTKSGIENGGGMGYNGIVFGEYHLDNTYAVRAAIDYAYISKAGVSEFYDYNMESETIDKTVVERKGLWNHKFSLGLVSVGFKMNLSNMLAGYNKKRKIDLSMFLGPTAVVAINDKASLSPDERVLEGHKVELVEPFGKQVTMGAHLGVKLNARILPKISAFVEPTLYWLGNINMPSVNFLSVKYMQTLNVGIQYDI